MCVDFYLKIDVFFKLKIKNTRGMGLYAPYWSQLACTISSFYTDNKQFL